MTVRWKHRPFFWFWFFTFLINSKNICGRKSRFWFSAPSIFLWGPNSNDCSIYTVSLWLDYFYWKKCVIQSRCSGKPEKRRCFLSKELIRDLDFQIPQQEWLYSIASCQDRPWRGWAKVVLLSFLALVTLLLVAAPQQCSSRLAQIVLRTGTPAHGRLQRYTVGAHNIQFPSPALLIG